jgi:hypothetical protein
LARRFQRLLISLFPKDTKDTSDNAHLARVSCVTGFAGQAVTLVTVSQHKGKPMSALFTDDQLSFAQRMDARQWAVLRALVDFPYPISASEAADPMLHALIKRKLASVTYSSLRCPIWTATPAARAVYFHLRPAEYRTRFGEFEAT